MARLGATTQQARAWQISPWDGITFSIIPAGLFFFAGISFIASSVAPEQRQVKISTILKSKLKKEYSMRMAA